MTEEFKKQFLTKHIEHHFMQLDELKASMK